MRQLLNTHCSYLSKLPTFYYTLSKGTRLIVALAPTVISASVGFFIGAGSRNEEENENGVAHFIEHMLFKGTKKRTSYQIATAIEGIGGVLNAYTCEDHTCLYARASAKYLSSMLDVLSDMLLNSVFDPGELEKERQVIVEEITTYEDQPQQLIQDLISEALWPKHPLGRPLTGTLHSVRQIKRKQLIDFYNTHYISRNLTVVIAGAVVPEECLKLVSNIDKRIKEGKRTPPIAATEAGPLPSKKVLRRSVEQVHMAIGFRVSSRRDDDRHAVRILSVLLGENMSSRLFVRLREEKGLAYSVSSMVNYLEDAGELVISFSADPTNLTKCIRIICDEISKLKDRPPTKKELNAAQEYVLGQTFLNLESTENLMTWIGEQTVGEFTPISLDQLEKAVLAVEPFDIVQVAKKYLQVNQIAISVICPKRYSLDSVLNKWDF